jgi:hypothetical protein
MSNQHIYSQVITFTVMLHGDISKWLPNYHIKCLINSKYSMNIHSDIAFNNIYITSTLLTRKLQNQMFLLAELKSSLRSKVLRSLPWLGWPVWNICVTNDYGYVPLVVNTSRSFPHAWLITRFVTRLTRRVPLVEQELLSLPNNLIFGRVRVTRCLVLCVCFVDHCLSFCTFSFGHCVVSSSIYEFWLPLWYVQTLLLQKCGRERQKPV